MNWRDIAQWNQIDPTGTLFVGASLYLYDAKPQADTSRTVESKPESYVVQSGDSLTNLAARFDLSLKQLADYNNLSVTDGLVQGKRSHWLSLKPIRVTINKQYVCQRQRHLRLKKWRPSPIR
ncbi:MAG: LysM peptidoglycan-binding domain-containing protein [Acinetobacter sp.]